MKSLKFLKNITLGLTILLISYISVHAGFGVSPTNINSEYLKPGASFTQEFTLSRSDATEDMNVQIVPDLGSIDSWFTFDPGKTFIFKKGQTTQKFKVIVKVPSDAQYTDYKGVIRVNALPTDQAVGGVSITQGVRLDAGLTVTEQDYRALSILSIKALDSQEGKPIRIEIVGQNDGNVDATPTVKVTVMDMLMNVLEEHEVANFGFVKPNETETLIAEIESKLPTGEYFIVVQVLLDGKVLREERLVFNIVNIPGEDKEQEEEKTGFQVGSIFTGFKDNVIYIFMSSLLVATAYLVLEKIWQIKKYKDVVNKQWAILLGSKKASRLVISLVLGISVLLLTVLAPILKHITWESLNIDINQLLIDLKNSMLYTLFSVVVFIGSHLLLEKIWRKKKSKTLKSKWYAILLGSKKYSRFILSFILAVVALFTSAFIPMISLQPITVSNESKIFDKVGLVFTDFNDYLPYVIFAIMSMIVSYLLLEKAWKKSTRVKKSSKPKKSTFWQILLGREKYSRAGLSLVIGCLVFALTISYTVLTSETEQAPTEDVQGVQDEKPEGSLNVLPEEQTYRYVVYEEDDINSKIIYVAQEGETFNVLQETEQWYTVELSDERIGWLPKTMVKSSMSEER